MQYYQLVIEAGVLINSIIETELRVEKLKAEAEELLETGKKSDAIEAKIKTHSVDELESQIPGSKRELEIVKKLLNQLPRFTREEIELAQPEYWETRLKRVAELQMLSTRLGADWAQLEAIYQTGDLGVALESIQVFSELTATGNNSITAERETEK